MSSTQRKYATANHPTIEALVHGLYRYKDRAQAVTRFKHIVDHFVLSKDQPESTADEPAALFWIKGFSVSEAETAKGFTGHFAEMRIVRLPDGLYSLTATKIDKAIANHPQKKRLKSKHPNWGHPVMRAVKKKKVYSSIEEANAELELLHLEFPEVSIPGQAKLYIIIYEKREGISRPTHKIALEIKANDGGGFVIAARDNEKPAKPKKALPDAQASEPLVADARPGHFAAQVLLRKKTRRKNAGRPVTGMKPETEE